MPDPTSNQGQGAESPTISVIGCGWLGFPLAQRLIQLGAKVHGSTTHPAKLKNLRNAGIEAALLRLEAESESAPATNVETDGLRLLFSSPQIVFNIPPSDALIPEDHIGQLRGLLRRLPSGLLRHFVFVSSTSVYGSASGHVSEDTEPQPQSTTGEILRETELFLEKAALEIGFALTIVRAAGLVGFGRHPGRFLAGRKDLKDPEQPINLVHQLDLVEALSRLLLAPAPPAGTSRVFNAVAASHPSRKEFYTAAALRMDLPPPEFLASDTSTSQGRRISGAKLKAQTEVKFQFDDWMDALRSRRL